MSHRSVRDAPPKPLLIFDGDCHFCRRWIERWREFTAGAIEYASSQEVAARFPEIPPEAYEKAVQFIETNGRVFSGAEAVFRSLGHKRGRRWMIWSYEHVPGFAGLTEVAYRVVARHRRVSSFFTRLFWGNDVRQPTYFNARGWFLRSLGGVYLIAFLSLWVQVDGLIGQHGILPVAEFLPAVRDQLGNNALFALPTLCWFSSSDAFLHVLCGAGAAISGVLIAGFLPGISLVLLFVLYLSLTIAGQTFLSFQWDILLLETGFLAIFFTPFLRLTRAGEGVPISRFGHFLLKLLLFKLMLMSGVVKLTSGDESWWNLTALEYHYWTQPLPTVLGWWAQQSPEWLRKFSTFFVLFVECVVPFFIWAPRRIRHIACALLILLQVLIALTGNYCFFNLLTIALCLLLIDDTIWPRRRSMVGRDAVPLANAFGVEPGIALDRSGSDGSTASRPTILAYSRRGAAFCALIILLPLNGMLIFSAFKPRTTWPGPIAALAGAVEPFRIVNGYGLFRVMTKSRPEIMVEGSADGIEWLPYEFKWKAGDLKQPPHWVAPHQPRLDWQMWFAALGTYQRNPWFVRFCLSLLKNDPSVTGLLSRNPFPKEPPRSIRATLYDYQFTSWEERQATGAWWKREIRAEYLPPISLRETPGATGE